MKVCLINNLYKPYARGGAETVVEMIAGGLKKEGHEVFIITTKPIFRKLQITNYKLQIYYVSGLYFNLNKIPKILRIFWHILDMFDIGSYWRVRSILKKEKPDVVMTHNLKGIGYLIPRAIKKSGIKHVHTLHDIQLLHPSGLMYYGNEKKIDSVFSKFYQGLCRWLFNPPDTVISPSKWLMKMHADRGFFMDSKKVVMPNPSVNTEHRTQNTEHKNKNKNFRFLYVGQIEEHKGILFLINAFCHFDHAAAGEKSLKGDLKFELLIAGDGSKFKKAQELVGQNKNIKLLGRIKNNEVMELMRSSDCFIMSSLCYENSPTVIYEAMGNGLPVIASRIGGVPELVQDSNFNINNSHVPHSRQRVREANNLLFEPENEKELISKMEWAVENRVGLQEMGESGKEKVKEFGVEGYVERLMEL